MEKNSTCFSSSFFFFSLEEQKKKKRIENCQSMFSFLFFFSIC